MPRVLFHYPVFNTGGAEMSVMRLTRFLAKNGWEVELLLTTGGGTMEPRIDSRVTVHHLRDFAAGESFAKATGAAKALRMITDFLPYLQTKAQEKKRTREFQDRVYDAAIVSLQGLSAKFCCENVRARNRILWIRNDLAKSDPDGKADRNIQAWKHKLDAYVSVSGSTKTSFDAKYPDLADKSHLVYNVLDVEEMKRLGSEAANPYSAYSDGLKVVTVCRLADKAKGLVRMLNVHHRLIEEGISHNWFLVGDGPDRTKIETMVAERGLQNSFHLMGQQSNPFPYYKFADISATLSYYEGLCGAVNEAKMMGKPVIATRFSGIGEQITSGENGLIVENEEVAIYHGMKQILVDGQLRSVLTNDCLPQAIRDDEYKLSQIERLVLAHPERSP